MSQVGAKVTVVEFLKGIAATLFQRDEQSSLLEVNKFDASASQTDQPRLCYCCGMPLSSTRTRDWIWIHNPRTCRLVNIALSEMGVSLDHLVRVEIYPSLGPLKGYYALTDPYTIHISEDAYLLFPEYTIFHETKHLIDCLTKGWSEEESPDEWARSLCLRYGFRFPPPQQYVEGRYKLPRS